HVTGGEPLRWIPGRPTEQTVELLVGHPKSGAVVEIAQIEPEGAVRLQVDEVIEDQLCVAGLTIGGEAHDLVLARVDLEARVVGEGGIEEADGVREVDLLDGGEAIALAQSHRRGGPLSHAVHGEDHRLLEGGGEERAGRMALMMLGEEEPMAPVDA